MSSVAEMKPSQVLRGNSIESRILPRINKTDSCWLWTGGINTSGYGQFYFKGKNHIASREMWKLTYGPIPDGLCVCHRCDVPSCVNPQHLFLGTHKDNMADRTAKGRHSSYQGEGHPAAKLNDGAVLEIRRRSLDGEKVKVLSDEFGVSMGSIYEIRRGDSWRHLLHD